jgi:hypothetical protein
VLFEKSKKVIEIDEIVDEKVPTFSPEEVGLLFRAKSADLGIAPYPVQAQRFHELCNKMCINRRITFNEMNLGVAFAQQFALILRGGKHRFAKIDLHKNLL